MWVWIDHKPCAIFISSQSKQPVIYMYYCLKSSSISADKAFNCMYGIYLNIYIYIFLIYIYGVFQCECCLFNLPYFRLQHLMACCFGGFGKRRPECLAAQCHWRSHGGSWRAWEASRRGEKSKCLLVFVALENFGWWFWLVDLWSLGGMVLLFQHVLPERARYRSVGTVWLFPWLRTWSWEVSLIQWALWSWPH